MTLVANYRREKPVYIVIDDMDNFLLLGKVFGEELDCTITDAMEDEGYDVFSRWVKGISCGLMLSP